MAELPPDKVPQAERPEAGLSTEGSGGHGDTEVIPGEDGRRGKEAGEKMWSRERSH